MSKFLKFIPYLIVILSFAGVLDSLYLTYEHYSGIVPPCSIHWWLTDCGKVLKSSYSMFFGLVPLATLGVLHYSVELILSIYAAYKHNYLAKILLKFQSSLGIIFSAYFVDLMVVVIHAICLYCLGSAVISLLIFLAVILSTDKQLIGE